jgi:tungstate transport system permease protein
VEFLLQSFWESIRMIARFDPDLVSALVTTLQVSLTSTTIASVLALPLGFVIALYEFPGKRAVRNLLRTSLALPTVVVGLLVYAFIARNAPLGEMKLLFTPVAIVIGQVLLIVPLITALVHAALQADVRDVYEESILLGASAFQATAKTLAESQLAVLTAIMTGFGRVVSEVGISLILGGNIRGLTRTITTAITLETSQGDFAVAFALGIVLLALVLLVNTIIIWMAGRHREAL